MKLINADCMDIMKQYPDNYFDLAITDPPYGIGADKPSHKPERKKQKNGNYLLVKNTNSYKHKNWDNERPKESYFTELKRVSKNQIIWGANYFDNLIGGRIVWDKINGESDQYDCEIAYQSINNRTEIVRYMWQGMFQGAYITKDIRKSLIQQGNKNLNEKRIHPTQKPIRLYKWLLDKYSEKGQKVLDTHLGSGSSAIASHYFGVGEFVGIEIDKDYFDAAEKRIKDQTKQLTMF